MKGVIPLRKPEEVRGTPLYWRRSLGRARYLSELVLQNTWLLVPYLAIILAATLALQSMGR